MSFPRTPPRSSLVAHATVPRIAVFGSSRSSRPIRHLRNPSASGSPLAFLVAGHRNGRIQVKLPTRPNGSTGWVDGGDLALAVDPYHLDIDLTHHRLKLTRSASVVQRHRIGVGRSLTPTPSGVYYVTALLRLTDPAGAYGPYAFATSAHSTVLNEFEGGDGRVGIHGTNEPWAIGDDISHGCIRLTNKAITRLAKVVPLGTPVTIHR
ncbi:MAG: hypothetical protein QOH13_1332 [Thermoleophilaceae bacterium]|nr:hypothetical protein [Thermoleophilaceae bacterium]